MSRKKRKGLRKSMPDEHSEWILATVEELRRHGSWCGRIHIHKLLFFVKAANLAEPPFEFELYHYGPYSFDLDSQIADLEMYGQLDRVFTRPGYGPQYSVVDEDHPYLETPNANAIHRVAEFFGPRSGKDLELLATALWALKIEGLSGDKLVQRVLELKPHFDNSQIKAAETEVAGFLKSTSS